MNEISNIPDPGSMKRVVIIGGGFGGLKVARQLSSNKFQIVLLDRNNHHLFQPLLYQVATSGIEPSAISFPFRKIFKHRKNFHIRICSALEVIPDKNRLITSIGEIAYDYLIIATGCSTNYFGNEALSLNTMSLKTTAEALFDRNQILDSFEKALNSRHEEEKQRLLSFVIVGGGATGIEMSGALAEMRKFILPKDYPDLDVNMMRIILIDAGPRLLPAFSEQSSDEVEKHLKTLHVEIRLNCQVKGYENETLTLGDNSELTSSNVFWVAGVKANSLPGFKPEAYGRGNRLNVDEYSHVKGYDAVFAIGDTAFMPTELYPNGHPQVVQPSIQQAGLLASNLTNLQEGKPPKKFVYNDKGSMATVGRNAAIVELKRFRLNGFIAWGIWLFIHLMSIVGVKNRLFIFIDWMWSYITYDQSLRLIIKPLRRKQKTD